MRQSHQDGPRTFDTILRRRAWTTLLFLLLSICALWAAASASDRSSGAAARPRREVAAQPAQPADAATSPEVWLCTGKGVLDLPAPDAPWSFVREHLSGIQFYIDMIDRATPEQLGQFVRLVRQQGYQVSVECGGHASDEIFCADTLKMVESYRTAGGRPTRWFVQSWYPHPTQIVPESAPHSLTALAKAVIRAVHSGVPPLNRGQDARDTARTPEDRRPVRRPGAASGDRIALQPQPGTMTVTAKVPGLGNQVFSLGIPETIGCREAMLLNFPEASVRWAGPDPQGAVSCSWGPGGRIPYSVRMIPADDYVDVEMTIRNHTEFFWHDVFAFNCLNPTGAPDFQDWTLERTYMSSQGQPLCLAKTQRVRGHMPTVGFYLPDRVEAGRESVFVRGFGATSPDRTDGSWIVTVSQREGTYMAAAVVDAAFLFDNLDRCCIHAAPAFGDIGPGQTGMTVSRFYLAKGSLEDFLKRYAADRPGLASRQKAAALPTAREQRIAAARTRGDSRQAMGEQGDSNAPVSKASRYSLHAKFEPPAGRVVHGMGQWEPYNAKLLPLLPAELRPASKLIFIDIGDTPRGWRPEAIRKMVERYGQDICVVIPSLDMVIAHQTARTGGLEQTLNNHPEFFSTLLSKVLAAVVSQPEDPSAEETTAIVERWDIYERSFGATGS